MDPIVAIVIGGFVTFFALLFWGMFFVQRGQVRLIDTSKQATIEELCQIHKDLRETGDGETVIGDYAISGKPTASLSTPHSRIPCVYYEYKKSEYWYEDREDSDGRMREVKRTKKVDSETNAAPFPLQEGDHTITVHPNMANFSYYEPITKHNSDSHYEYEEKIMETNVDFTIFGTVVSRPDELAIETNKKYDRMIISNKPYNTIVDELTKTTKRYLIAGIICGIIGAGALVYGIMFV